MSIEHIIWQEPLNQPKEAGKQYFLPSYFISDLLVNSLDFFFETVNNLLVQQIREKKKNHINSFILISLPIFRF